MFDTVLIANRGEIALRVMRACKELGLRTVAVYSEADREAPHVAYADAAYLIGPAPAAQSYLDIDTLIAVAQKAGAGAIHPGYGFLAENPAFVRACTAAGLIFIGPTAEVMERMGGKTAARREATTAGVPLVPGTLERIEHPDEVRQLGEEFGYPIAIKAVGGGGGRGLRVVRRADEIDAAFESARREAEVGFKNPDVYVEKYLDHPRHIEIQVLADSYGNVIHLGERDCSIQRRHQKLVEEAPSPALTPALREQMGTAAVALARSVGYVSAGTLEFLFQDGQFFFLEMNTRIQVEHTVTEMVTGVDLVQAQLRIARGERLWLTQQDIQWRGHAIECRINAEDPSANFRPALGTIELYSEPTGFGVRVDGAARSGYTIPPHYDSLIAKLIAWGGDRADAIRRMRRALADYRLDGVTTTIPFHQLVMAHSAFAAGAVTVNFIPEHLSAQLAALPPPSSIPPVREEPHGEARDFLVEVNGKRFAVHVAERARQHAAQANGRKGGIGGRRGLARKADAVPANAIVSPIQGTVAAIKCSPGQVVEAGSVLFIIEAMKMENEVTAPRSGTIAEIPVKLSQAVEAGASLATYAQG